MGGRVRMGEVDPTMGCGDRADRPPTVGQRASRVRRVLGGAFGLSARAAWPLVRTLLSGLGLLALLAVPLWVWLNLAVQMLDLSSQQLATGDVVALIALVGVPSIIVLLVVGLATWAGMAIVLDDVAVGRRPRAVRAVGRGLRAVPRLAVTVVPALVVMAALLAAAPVVVLLGIILLPVTLIGRRFRPAARWPGTRTLTTMIVPFGAAAMCAARWLALPAVVVLQGSGPSRSFRSSGTMARPRVVDLAVAIGSLVAGAVAIGLASSALLAIGGATQAVRDVVVVGVEGVTLVVMAAMAVRVFADAGGVAAAPPDPTPPRVVVAAAVTFALVAQLAPMVVAAPAAHATAPGATIVVDDLGDAEDVTPGDGACATAAATCTLRAAVSEANASSEEVIGFAVSGTITLGSTLHLARPVAIDGSGAEITVSGGGTTSVFFIQMEVMGGGYGAIRNLTIADGHDGSTGGAAIYNSGTSAGFVLDGVTVRDSTVTADAMFGGAVVNLSKLAITNSTFVGNDADPAIEGSDVANRFSGDLTIVGSTFTASTGSSSISSDGEAADVRGSIVTGAAFACNGPITGAGNVTTDPSAVCPGVLATPAQLGLAGLAHNGGPTPTVRLTAASAAIDAGDPGACPATDQRGAPRPKGATCDAGAYEFDPVTTTSLAATPNPSSFGDSVSLDATVTADVEPGTPTGSVRFSDGGALLGDVPVDPDGAASLSVASLAAGAHTLTATYVPDAGYASSTSAAVPLTVEAAGTAVSLTSSSSSTLGGDPVTFTIEVTAPGSVPTGSVTLFDGGAPLNTSALDANGQATFTTSDLAGGPHVLTASYGGDAGHGTATSPPLAHDVVAASTTALTGPTGPTVYGNPAAFDVVVTPIGGGATPTGTVVLSAGEATLGTGTLDATGRATVDVTGLPPGTHQVRASYSGDSYNGASTSSPVGHEVTGAATEVALTVAPAGTTPFGVTVTLQAVVTAPDSAAIPAGTITFADASGTIGVGGIDPSGTATFSTAELAPGTYELRADYAPATGFEVSSSSSVAHTVVAASTAVELTTSSTASAFGEAVTLGATVTTLDSPRTATGSVTFRDGAAVLGVVPIEGGAATLVTSAIAVGSRTLTAEHHGEERFSGATSPAVAHAVTAASVAVQLSDAPDPSVFGGTVAIDVAVTVVAPGSGVPTGTVTIREGATVLASVTLDATGHATAALTGLSVGTHELTAGYVGDGSFAPGTTTATHTVAPDTATVALSSSAPDAQFTHPVTFTAGVSGTGTARPTGTVTFRDGATVLGAVPLDADGVARLTTTSLRYGTFLVTADYGGDAGFGAATASITQDVDATGTATTLVVDLPAPTVADMVTLTATVVGTSSAVIPAGSVTFYDGAVVLATVPVDAAGRATFSQPFSRAVHTLTAGFTGRPGWVVSTSAAVTITPARAPTSIALSGAPSSVAVGGSVTWTAALALAPVGPTPTGTIRFWSGSTFLGEGSIAGGVATLTLSAPPAVGPWSVVATYDGDADHEPASSPEASIPVAAAATSVIAVIPPNSYVGDLIVLGANVTSTLTGVPIDGVVRFSSDSPGSTTLTAAVDTTGWASVTASGVPAGAWDLTATYEPSSSAVFAGSSTVAPMVVSRRPASVGLSAPPEVTVGVELSISFSVGDLTGTGATPTGTVAISAGEASCSAPVAAGRCRLTIASPGPVTLTASYSGDAAYAPATSGPTTVVARGGTPTLTAWTPTGTWASGDPVTIVWQLDGPRTAEVVVRTPFGEACRSTTVPLGSCTVTFPFEQRGQAIPVDVSYAGSDGWQPASAAVTGTVVGCYELQLSVEPAEGGTLTGPSGNCNRGTGFLAGTRVGVAVEPIPPYQLERWLEDGSTSLAYSFVVGDGATTATALVAVPCAEVRFGRGEAYDLGDLASMGGLVEATAPNCPTRPEVGYDAETGGSRAWYLPGTPVTFTAVPTRPEVDEVKLWEVDGHARRAAEPLTVVDEDDPQVEPGGEAGRAAEPLTLIVEEDVQVEARFGVRCARPTFASLGGGTVEPFTQEDCVDPAGDMAWQQGSEVGARLVPERTHWVSGYTQRGLVRAVTAPPAARTMGVDIDTVTAFWRATDDLAVEVSFETCRRLTTAPNGPGRIEVATAPNCPTRTLTEGPWFQPGTRVAVRAVPDAPSRKVENRLGPAGARQPLGTIPDDQLSGQSRPAVERKPTFVWVEPEFLRWEEGVDRPSYWADLEAPPPDEPTAVVTLTEDRTVTAAFYDAGRCMPFVSEVVPAGAAELQVSIQGDQRRCPAGEADLGDVRQATFVADPVADAPRVGWALTTTDDATDQSVDRRLENDGAPVPIKNRTLATAYVCVAIAPEITLIAPDRSEVTGPPPPGSDFVSTDVAPDCPLWENAFTVGTEVTVAAMAPPAGYEFSHWEGDVSGRDLDVRVRLDGSRPTIKARAVYRVRCVTITFEPADRVPEVSPGSNCPSMADEGSQPPSDGAEAWDPQGELAPNQRRFIGGTPVMLDARQIDNHDFSSWGGEGLLGREEMIEAFTQAGLPDLVALTEAMDHPAIITADFDQTIWADYAKHSVGKQIGDDLAVAGKKIVGVLSLITIGAFEGIALGTFRLAFSALSFLTKAISPGATDTVKVFDRVQQYFDLMELTLLCTAEWSKGTPPKNPATPDKLAGNGIVPPVQTEDVVTSTANLAGSGVDLSEALTNYRFAKDPRFVADYSVKIPKTKFTVLSGTTATQLKVAWKALGAAASVGTAIYSFVSDGPGIVWEDTAAQAWNTGPGPFEDCVQRELHEAFPEDVPPPPSVK